MLFTPTRHGAKAVKPVERRPSARQRGYTWRWEKASKQYLRRNPLCVYHLEMTGLLVPADTVDHRIPHKGDRLLMWSESNWAGACKTCNSAKQDRTAEEFSDGKVSNVAAQ